jgi:CRISPR/Cas system CSM-associated protein Csm5 (group 7 of RAMP superfamily)
MSNIKIETLTPVHIGSGNMLQNNADFIVTKKMAIALFTLLRSAKYLNQLGKSI